MVGGQIQITQIQRRAPYSSAFLDNHFPTLHYITGIVLSIENKEETVHLSMYENLKNKLWEFMEHPESSIAARTFTFLSAAVIFMSIIAAVLETIPQLNTDDDHHGKRRLSDP